MNENIEPNTILEVTENKGVIHLLKNLKCIVTVVEPDHPFLNITHSTSLVFCETNVRYTQYKTNSAT